MTAFTEYSYIWPARPSKAIPSQLLTFYEERGWVAQFKKNGTCTVLYVTPEREVIVKTRHNDDHKNWKPDASGEWFKTIPGKNWYVFFVEVLHNKVSTIKDTIYVFDIAVSDGTLLVNKTFTERQQIIKNLFGIDKNLHVNATPSHYVINDKLWVARCIESGFSDIMKFIQNRADKTEGNPEDEGLVLKNPTAIFDRPSRQTSNSDWQVKCRVGSKNFSF